MLSDCKSGKQAARIATNLTELWEGEAQRELLALYAASVGRGRPLYSDFDRFLALCEILTFADGHDEQARCRKILAEDLGIDSEPTPENAGQIWKRSAEQLLLKPRAPIEKVFDTSAYRKSQALDLPMAAASIGIPTRFWAGEAESIAQWQNDLREWQGAQDMDVVSVSLSDDFVFVSPNPYSVKRALASSNRTAGERDLLMAQTLRELSPLLQSREGGLRLWVGDCGDEAVKLLSYMEKSVGLPSVTWSTASPSSHEALLDYSVLPHRRLISPLLHISDRGAQKEEIERYSKRFPSGLLMLTDEFRKEYLK